MVIVYAQVGIVGSLVRGPVRLGAERNVCKSGSFKVDIQRERECVAHIVLFGLVAVVYIRRECYRILRVVLEVALYRAVIEVNRRIVYRAA